MQFGWMRVLVEIEMLVACYKAELVNEEKMKEIRFLALFLCM
jgi:hypothetical protein